MAVDHDFGSLHVYQVRIWGGGQPSPLAVLMPHEGQPVGCVFFVMSPTQPEEAILLTSVKFFELLSLCWMLPTIVSMKIVLDNLFTRVRMGFLGVSFQSFARAFIARFAIHI